jgi:hypothetical protein
VLVYHNCIQMAMNQHVTNTYTVHQNHGQQHQWRLMDDSSRWMQYDADVGAKDWNPGNDVGDRNGGNGDDTSGRTHNENICAGMAMAPQWSYGYTFAGIISTHDMYPYFTVLITDESTGLFNAYTVVLITRQSPDHYYHMDLVPKLQQMRYHDNYCDDYTLVTMTSTLLDTCSPLLGTACCCNDDVIETY